MEEFCAQAYAKVEGAGVRGGILDLILLSCLRHWASYAILSDLSFPNSLRGPKDL